MPGSVPNTSTYALTNVTLPYAVALADKGWQQALIDDVHLRHGLNVHAGHVTYAAVAKDLSLDYRSAETILGPLPYTTAA
jgi:alanine dehydrogenase